MSEYEMRTLIDELEKLVVSKSREIFLKDCEIKELKKQVESLEAKTERLGNLLATPTHDAKENEIKK